MAIETQSKLKQQNICFIGYGEAAQAFTQGWSGTIDISISAYDIRTDIEGPIRDNQIDAFEHNGVLGHMNSCDAIEASTIIFSMVTADQAVSAAQAAAVGNIAEKLYFDCNSVAPQTKQKARDIIEAAGGKYVDVAIMAPVHPNLHKTPALICGPHSNLALASLQALELNVKVVEGDVGSAAAIKLCRSIVIKGLEALSAEMMCIAQTLGVEESVIQSLDRSHPGFDWKTQSNYALDRMMVHGHRRGAEMGEAVGMLRHHGIPSDVSQATAVWQNRVAELQAASGQIAGEPPMLVDDVLHQLGRKSQAY